MSGYNNSLRYYKKYYEGIKWLDESDSERNERHFKKKNAELFASCFPSRDLFEYPSHLIAIELETTYPGLLLGSGINHGSNRLGELKLGYQLDYTTGLPVIPGSSVKGVLRSAFPGGYRKAAQRKDISADEKLLLKLKKDRAKAYIKHLLTKDLALPECSEDIIDQLEDFLFGSYESGKASDTAMSSRVIFHDALPVNANRVKVNEKHNLSYLGSDYITPHINRNKKNHLPDEMVNPVPIGFLKVLPGVVFRFQFDIKPFDEKVYKLSEQNIRDLFEAILLQMGTGAKTNVGYGQWKKPGPEPDPSKIEKRKDKTVGSTKQPDETKNNPPPKKEKPQVQLDFSALPAGQYYAKVLPPKEQSGKFGDIKRLQVLTTVADEYYPFRAKDGSLNDYQPGTILIVSITVDQSNKKQITGFIIIGTHSSNPQ